MNKSTLCPVDVVGITVSPGVKPKMYLWFVVTHVHLLSRSCNDCFNEAHWVLQTFPKTEQVTAPAKEMYIKAKGGTTRTSSGRVKNDKCPFAHTALQTWGWDSPSAAEDLIIQHLQPRTWVLCNWNVSPDLNVSFPANNRVASSNFSLKQLYLRPFLSWILWTAQMTKFSQEAEMWEHFEDNEEQGSVGNTTIFCL